MMPSTTEHYPPLLTAAEVAAMLGVHRDTVCRLAAQGVLPHLRVGTLLRFRASSIATWVERREQRSRRMIGTCRTPTDPRVRGEGADEGG